jgi:endonuclease YncB( thermonuclease family)
MAAGLLEVDGSIDIAQFWPVGSSDADTSQIKVDVTGNAFRFRPHDSAPFQVTHALDSAKVKGSATYDAIRNGKITVRLQGMDAPELHYRPAAAKKKADQTEEQHTLYLKWNLEFRQLLAESATIALTGFFQGIGTSPIACMVRTAVDTPDEVFDTYGRFVGDIFVRPGGNDVDVNHWIVENGWAFPAFYSSMSEPEITTIVALANQAFESGLGVWPHLDDFARASDFDINLVFRGKGAAPNPAADVGCVVVPKLFRRLAAYVVNKKAKMISGSFESYLRSKRSSDSVHLTSEFLSQGASAAPVWFLDEFVQSGFVTVWPEELVFREKPSTVVGPGGAPVTSF